MAAKFVCSVQFNCSSRQNILEKIKLDFHIGESVAEKKGSGFQSAAGLIRYFDEEEDLGPVMDPKLVLYIALVFGAMMELLKVFWPL